MVKNVWDKSYKTSGLLEMTQPFKNQVIHAMAYQSVMKPKQQNESGIELLANPAEQNLNLGKQREDLSDDDEMVRRSDSNNPLQIHGNSNFYKTEKSGKLKSNQTAIAYNTIGPSKQSWVAKEMTVKQTIRSRGVKHMSNVSSSHQQELLEDLVGFAGMPEYQRHHDLERTGLEFVNDGQFVQGYPGDLEKGLAHKGMLRPSQTPNPAMTPLDGEPEEVEMDTD